jgi:predicted amidohydrolase YtcJ
MNAPITVFRARRIITMNPSNPVGTHVAVREGKVLGVGSYEEVAGWGDHVVDDRFADHVLTPGMIEVHSHQFEGVTGMLPYQGFFDRPAPDGRILPGLQSIDALLDDLRRLDGEMEDPDEALVTLGFDPIHLHGARIDRTHLDQVSTTRPIMLFHASLHLATANSAMLARHDITASTPGIGVMKGADGEPTGELHEMPAMALAQSALTKLVGALGSEQSIWNLGRMARQVGVTCVGDLASAVVTRPASLVAWQRIVNDPTFPARVTLYPTPGPLATAVDFGAAADAVRRLQTEEATDKLRFPGVKFVLDGSIQGWTAQMRWPGYYTGEDHGQLLTVPEQFVDWARPFHERGINMHIHCNGEATIGLAIDTVDQLLREVAWLDHRHTIQHSQLTTTADFRRMKTLGMCANIFVNHIWYWGDAHYEQTVGPERANRMEPCGTAQRLGVPFALHSDASVTPLGPLHLMWCAVNRLTPSGRVLGEHEKISAADALRAVTIDAAYQMHLDDELGSIEIGKWADFTVLEESPLDVDPLHIKDIGVWGTVVGGVPFPAETHD